MASETNRERARYLVVDAEYDRYIMRADGRDILIDRVEAALTAAEARGAARERCVQAGLTGAFRDVLAFHCAMGLGRGETPAVPSPQKRALRRRLLEEEFAETMAAWNADDLPAFADGLADLIYVAVGSAIDYGIDLPAVWSAVQRANMAKADGPKDAGGKQLKPAGWTVPDVVGVLMRQPSLSATYDATNIAAAIRQEPA